MVRTIYFHPSSYRRVSPEDVQACEEKYNKSKMVHSILRHVAETTVSYDLESLYKVSKCYYPIKFLTRLQNLGWPLYDLYGHAFEAFRLMVTDAENVLNKVASVASDRVILEDHVKKALIKDIRRRMTPQPLKIRADVEITCFGYDGIEHIRTALRAAEAVSTEDCAVKVSLVASPLFVFTTQTAEKNVGVDAITRAISAATVSKIQVFLSHRFHFLLGLHHN